MHELFRPPERNSFPVQRTEELIIDGCSETWELVRGGSTDLPTNYFNPTQNRWLKLSPVPAFDDKLALDLHCTRLSLAVSGLSHPKQVVRSHSVECRHGTRPAFSTPHLGPTLDMLNLWREASPPHQALKLTTWLDAAYQLASLQASFLYLWAGIFMADPNSSNILITRLPGYSTTVLIDLADDTIRDQRFPELSLENCGSPSQLQAATAGELRTVVSQILFRFAACQAILGLSRATITNQIEQLIQQRAEWLTRLKSSDTQTSLRQPDPLVMLLE